MRYILKSTNRRTKGDDIAEERIVDAGDVRAAFNEAMHKSVDNGWMAAVIYKEYDSMGEVPVGETGCRLHIGEDGKRTLRQCRVSQGW